MQLTENDKTTQMPATLPANFFIPDADYDASVASAGGAAHAPPVPPPTTSTITATNEQLSDSISDALKTINIPPSLITQVQSMVSNQIRNLAH